MVSLIGSAHRRGTGGDSRRLFFFGDTWDWPFLFEEGSAGRILVDDAPERFLGAIAHSPCWFGNWHQRRHT